MVTTVNLITQVAAILPQEIKIREENELKRKIGNSRKDTEKRMKMKLMNLWKGILREEGKIDCTRKILNKNITLKMTMLKMKKICKIKSKLN